MTTIPLGHRSPGASSNLPERQDPDTDSEARASRRPYSVLLPVGFAVPLPLPVARCALTAPFHPCRGVRNAPRRSVLCGTFPRVTPAGCYPAPCVHGARTFLPGYLSVIPRAAVQPTDGLSMGALCGSVKCLKKKASGREDARGLECGWGGRATFTTFKPGSRPAAEKSACARDRRCIADVMPSISPTEIFAQRPKDLRPWLWTKRGCQTRAPGES